MPPGRVPGRATAGRGSQGQGGNTGIEGNTGGGSSSEGSEGDSPRSQWRASGIPGPGPGGNPRPRTDEALMDADNVPGITDEDPGPFPAVVPRSYGLQAFNDRSLEPEFVMPHSWSEALNIPIAVLGAQALTQIRKSRASAMLKEVDSAIEMLRDLNPLPWVMIAGSLLGRKSVDVIAPDSSEVARLPTLNTQQRAATTDSDDTSPADRASPRPPTSSPSRKTPEPPLAAADYDMDSSEAAPIEDHDPPAMNSEPGPEVSFLF